jgi:PAS domain S-box-containing protein
MAVAPAPKESAGQRREWNGERSSETGSPGRAGRGATELLEELSGSAPRVRALVRIGAICAILFESAFLYQKIGSADLERTLPLHLFNVALGMVLLGFALSPWFGRYWRGLTVAACAALMASTSALGVVSGRFEPVFVTVVVLVLAGASLPWSVNYQAALGAMGVASYLAPVLIHPEPDPAFLVHWLGLAASVALAQASVVRRVRNYRELSAARAALKLQVGALYESEQKFRSFFEASLDPIVITELQSGRILDVNRSFVTRTGYPREMALGRTTVELGMWPDTTVREKMLAQLMADGYLRDIEVSHRASNGERIPMLVSSVIVKIAGRDCVITVLHDITEMKKAQEELRENEKKFREIFDSSLDFIVVLSLADGRFLDVNREVTRTLGYTREEAIGKTPVELGVWTQRSLRRSLDREVRNKGFYRSVEVDLRAKDGRIIHCLSSAVLTRIGAEDCVVVFARDITYLKEAERKLRDSEATLRQIFETSLDEIVVLDIPSGRVLDVNPEFLRNIGLPRAAVVGKLLTQLLECAPEQQKKLRAELFRRGIVRNFEVNLRRPDGRPHDLLVSMALTYLNGRPCAISFGRDISELKAAERALRNSEEKFRQIFESNLDIVLIADRETGKIIEVNEEFVRRTGFSRAEALGRTSVEIGIWANPEQRLELSRALNERGYVHGMEAKLKTRTGASIATLISSALIRLGGKECVLSVARDISDLKAVESALRESEQKFRKIFEKNVDMVLLTSLTTGTVIEVNEEFERISGWSREESLGKSNADLNVWVDLEARDRFFAELKEKGYVKSFESDMRLKNGAIIPVLVSSVSIRLGNQDCTVTVMRDISRLREAEREVRQSEATLRQIFDASTDCISLVDAETGQFINLNQAFVEFTGYSRDEIIGQTGIELGFWGDPSEREAFYRVLREKGRVHNLELDFHVKGGGCFPCLVSAVTLEVRGRRCVLVLARDISERKQAERKLRQSEETLRRIFNSSLDPMAINDMRDGSYVEVNDAFLEITGLAREEVIGRTFRDLGVWPDKAQWKEYDRRLKDYGKVRNLEATFRVRGGAIVPALISGVVIEMEGRPCLLSIVRDISVLKDAERKLRESEAVLRKTFDSVIDPLSVTDIADGRYIDVNEEFLRLSGYSRDEVIGATYWDLGIWDNRADENDIMRRLTAHGEVRNVEITFRTRNGATIPTLVSAVVVELGGRQCALWIARDITELKDAECKLRESEAVLRKTFDSVIDPMSVVDVETGRYLDINDEVARIFGYSREEIIGRTNRQLGIWDSPADEARFIALLNEQGEVRNQEFTFRARDGRRIPALVSASIVDLGGRRCALSIARDITELKETQRELVAAREAALAASNAKSEFLSSMSHEIRTPMNAILGMADLLWETDLSHEQRRYLDTVISNGNALLDLINSILDLARVESGRLSLEAVEFDVGELVEKVVETLAIRAHEKGVELGVRLAPDLPETVIGDPLRLRQVLTNLVGNAIKFTEQGEVEVCVERAAGESSPAALRFSVRDTGIGIPPDKLATIFSPFTQADSSTTRRFGGSGLGLTIVDRLVRLMGGRIDVESTCGRGSIFRFTAQFVEPAGQAGAQSRPAPRLDGAQILVVDDSPMARSIAREALERLGATVVEASSAAEGLASLSRAHQASRPFDVAFIDCRMAASDGLEMAARMREAGDQTPAVMMPESVELSATLARMKQLDLKRYLLKPIKMREMSAMAAAVLSRAPDVEAPARTQSSAPEVLSHPLRILLADDSADNRALIRAYLKDTRCVIDEVEDGRAAFEQVKACHYDLVLMDIQMPVLDGYTAVRMIRRWEQDHAKLPTPIIALTASALDDEVRRAIEAGCDLHVSKPVKKATLLDSIAKAMHNARSPIEPRANGNGKHAGPVVEIDADISDLIPGFLERKRIDARSVAEALDRGDFEAVARIAHRLKGEGGSYGFNEISEVGAALEIASKAGQLEVARGLARELAAYLESVQVVYQEAAE